MTRHQLVNGKPQRRNFMRQEKYFSLPDTAVRIFFRLRHLKWHVTAGRIFQYQRPNSGFGETNLHLCHVGPRPAQRIEHRNGDAVAACINFRGDAVQAVLDNLIRQAFRKTIAGHRILIYLIYHHPGSQIMSLVEEHRFPGAFQIFLAASDSQ